MLKDIVPVQVIQGEDALGRVLGREQPEARDDGGQLGGEVEDLLQNRDERGDGDVAPVALDEVVVCERVHGWARGPELTRLARLPFGKVKHGNGWTHEGQRGKRPEAHGREIEQGYSYQEFAVFSSTPRSAQNDCLAVQTGDENRPNSRYHAITLYFWRRRWAEYRDPMADSAEAYVPRLLSKSR